MLTLSKCQELTGTYMTDKLLIVDDSAFSRRMINKAIPDSWEAAISEANDGESALAMCETLNFDYIFLDLTMPEMDGIEVMKRLNEKKYAAKVFIISADIQQAVREEAEELGAIAFIPKPISAEKLEMFLREKGVIA